MTSVVQRLEESTSGLITKPELEAAIVEASQEHQVVLSAQTTEALVESLFEQADIENAGKVTRQAVFEALEEQEEDALEIFGQDPSVDLLTQRAANLKRYVIENGQMIELPQDQAMIATVMDVLEQSDKGLLPKNEIAVAIQKAAKEQQIFLDLAQTQSFVQNVFAQADTDNTGLVSRKALHQALEDQDDEAMAIFGGGQQTEKQKLKKRAKHMKNYVIDEGEVREVPLQTATVQSVMQVLEQSENGKLAKREVAEAIQAVAEQQQIVLDSVALDALVSNVFSTADSNAEGAVSRKALHNALTHEVQVAELFTMKTLPVAMDTVTNKVMVQLNAQSNGKITSRDLKEALKTVAQQNGAQVDLAQSKALIEKVFLTDNQLSRGEVRKALDENQVEAAHIVKETALPESTPVIQQVMQVLEASDSGMIDKVTLQAALKQVAKDDRIVIDPALTTSFVQQVFQSADSDNQGEVTRQKVEMALASHNVEAFQLFKEQVVVPVQSDSVSKKLMNVLSTSQKGTITAKDLKEALKVVATQNG